MWRKGRDTGVGLDKRPCISAAKLVVGHLPLMGDGEGGVMETKGLNRRMGHCRRST